jgi:thymidine kinase
MSLELLIGPMFAGKSSVLQSIVKRHRSHGWSVMVITHVIDKRYGDDPQIVNHDLQRLPAIGADELLPLLDHPEYVAARLIVVEEAQFFKDLVPFIARAVDIDSKHAVVVGLDGDADRRKFGHVLDLIPYADRVQKLTALCKECSDAIPAIFTFAVPSAAETISSGQPCVGASEKYIPMCRKHYLAAVSRHRCDPGAQQTSALKN